MKRILYEKTPWQTVEDNESISLQYFLLENELKIEGCSIKCYGIEIKKTSNISSQELSEVKQIPNVFFRRKEAVSFLKKLYEGMVTPIALSGILEDYISDSMHLENRIPMIV